MAQVVRLELCKRDMDELRDGVISVVVHKLGMTVGAGNLTVGWKAYEGTKICTRNILQVYEFRSAETIESRKKLRNKQPRARCMAQE